MISIVLRYVFFAAFIALMTYMLKRSVTQEDRMELHTILNTEVRKMEFLRVFIIDKMDGAMVPVQVNAEMLMELIEEINNGKEDMTVMLKSRVVEVGGVVIPAKGKRYMILPLDEEAE